MAKARICRLVQVGANEGMFEYAKPDGKDFVFELLKENPQWSALLIEPIPEIFERLKANYVKHDNELHFLNCAITNNVERRVLTVVGRDGKSSTLIEGFRDDRAKEHIQVDCLPLKLACDSASFDDIDFLKVDAEGYDEEIVQQALSDFPKAGPPRIVMWEQLAPERLGLSDQFRAAGYTVLRTGRAKNGRYMDIVAISNRLSVAA